MVALFSYLLSSHGKICLTTEWININMGVEPPKSNTRLDHTVYNQTEEIIWFDHFFLCSLVYTIKPYKRSIPYYTIKDVIFYSQIGSSPSDTTGRNHEILGDLSNRKRGFHRQKWTFKLFNNGCDLFG